jgi:hypothetical protein
MIKSLSFMVSLHTQNPDKIRINLNSLMLPWYCKGFGDFNQRQWLSFACVKTTPCNAGGYRRGAGARGRRSHVHRHGPSIRNGVSEGVPASGWRWLTHGG